MEPFDDHDAALIAQLDRQLGEATMLALETIPAYPPFSKLPERVNTRMIAEFARIADTNAVSRPELRMLLQETIPGYLSSLRHRLILHPNLGSMRIAVLVHVAMVVGLGNLLGMTRLWQAIHDNRWDEAARALLKSNWPGSASTEAERDRIVDIADIFRTGMAPTAWTT